MDLSFLMTSIVITATPGAGALFTIAAGISRGARAGMIAAIGCTLGIVPHLVLALTGVAVVVSTNRALFEALRWLGVGYMLSLAWGMWRDERGFAAGEGSVQPRATRVIREAVLVNLLNPKLTIFFFVFLPMFVGGSASAAPLQLAGLGAAFMVITLVIFGVYGVAAARLGRFVTARPRINRLLGRGFAVTFVVLAGLLAIAPH